MQQYKDASFFGISNQFEQVEQRPFDNPVKPFKIKGNRYGLQFLIGLDCGCVNPRMSREVNGQCID